LIPGCSSENLEPVDSCSAVVALPIDLGPFRPRAPWLTGDLQTLRDSLRPVSLPRDRGEPVDVEVGGGDRLRAVLDAPLSGAAPQGWVLLLHGLGGSSNREGLRRMGHALQQAGFAVIRLNMRGAGPSRHLAAGTYAANSNRDVLPVLRWARQHAGGRPLFGMGISLGGTKLLNALLAAPVQHAAAGLQQPLLDGLVCISSPLDLEACSDQIERPRNRLYQSWLLKRLVEQTLADPFGITPQERQALTAGGGPRTIRAFDAAITAPRWRYASVEAYYAQASPLHGLLPLLRQPSAWQAVMPPTLLLHALDDPWVPAAATQQLAAAARQGVALEVVLTERGGHNGFHAVDDGPEGCWGDRLTARWFQHLVKQG
jgi:predicted alpha/beta-fold hydrolase